MMQRFGQRMLVWNFKIWYLLSGNRLPVAKMLSEMFLNAFEYFWKHVIDYTRLVIDYQQLKLFITASRILNSNFKACNQLNKACNRLPEGIFENNFQQSHLFKYFWMAIKGLYIGDLGYENFREFLCTKSLILSKTKLSYPLKTFLGQKHLQIQ